MKKTIRMMGLMIIVAVLVCCVQQSQRDELIEVYPLVISTNLYDPFDDNQWTDCVGDDNWGVTGGYGYDTTTATGAAVAKRALTINISNETEFKVSVYVNVSLNYVKVAIYNDSIPGNAYDFLMVHETNKIQVVKCTEVSSSCHGGSCTSIYDHDWTNWTDIKNYTLWRRSNGTLEVWIDDAYEFGTTVDTTYSSFNQASIRIHLANSRVYDLWVLSGTATTTTSTSTTTTVPIPSITNVDYNITNTSVVNGTWIRIEANATNISHVDTGLFEKNWTTNYTASNVTNETFYYDWDTSLESGTFNWTFWINNTAGNWTSRQANRNITVITTTTSTSTSTTSTSTSTTTSIPIKYFVAINCDKSDIC